jgi:hypothetical protein
MVHARKGGQLALLCRGGQAAHIHHGQAIWAQHHLGRQRQLWGAGGGGWGWARGADREAGSIRVYPEWLRVHQSVVSRGGECVCVWGGGQSECRLYAGKRDGQTVSAVCMQEPTHR